MEQLTTLKEREIRTLLMEIKCPMVIYLIIRLQRTKENIEVYQFFVTIMKYTETGYRCILAHDSGDTLGSSSGECIFAGREPRQPRLSHMNTQGACLCMCLGGLSSSSYKANRV
jgi:hypothetical protein